MAEITKQSVSLDTLDRNIVSEVAETKGLNFSAALRLIIREWQELQAERIIITEAGRQALAEAHREAESV